MADRRIGGTDRESYVRGTQKNGKVTRAELLYGTSIPDRSSMAKWKAGTLYLSDSKAMMVHMEAVQLLSDLGYPKIPEIPIWSWCQIELKNTIHVGKENEILALESRFPEKP